jgi:hypothetical protein
MTLLLNDRMHTGWITKEYYYFVLREEWEWGWLKIIEYSVGGRRGLKEEKEKFGLATQTVLRIYHCYSLWGYGNIQ